MKTLCKVLFITALLVASFFAGRRFNHEINFLTKVDTVMIRETTMVDKPVYINRMTVDTMLVAVHDTSVINDTVYMVLDREQRHYRDDDYEAWVSGYKPSLDSLRLYPETKIIREETRVASTQRWVVGLHAGYGVGYFVTPVGRQPGAGPVLSLGVTFRF